MKRRTLNNTEFRPRLPVDPFGDTPWVLDLDSLSSLSATATTATILVLNTPPPADLAALLCASPALANSLVIIATHDVPVIPQAWQIVPTVRVLKLSEPLFNATGALGIMSVLDRVARFVSTPRPSTAGEKVQVYAEDSATREFTVRADDYLTNSKQAVPTTNGTGAAPTLTKKASSSSMPLLSPPTATVSEKARNRRTFNFGGFGSTPSSAASSVSSSPASSVLSLHSSGSTTPITAPSSPMLAAKPLALSQVPSGTRPFDTLIHYMLGPSTLPSPASLSPPSMQQASSSAKHLPEKMLLKQAILVTTLSAPYLAVPPEPPAVLRNGYRSSTIGVSRTRTNSSYETGSLPSSSKKMLASKSVPEGMGGMFKKRRETLPPPVPSMPPLSPAQTSSEGTEEGDINPSKSTSSFKSLKKRFTLSRRSIHIPEAPPPLPVTEDGRLEGSNTTLPTSTSLKKRFSLLSRSNRSSFLPNADDFSAQLEAYAKLQQASLTRYNGRGHIVHVLVETSDHAALDLAPNPKGKRTSVPVPRRPGALVKGIEQFLVAFAYPVQGISASMSGSPTVSPSSSFKSSSSGADLKYQGPGDKTKPIPFIVRGGTLGAVFKLNIVSGTFDQPAASEQDDEKNVSLAECVVFGGLDNGERHGSWKAWLDVAGDFQIKNAGRLKMDPRTIEDMVGVHHISTSKDLEAWDQKREERTNHKAGASLSAGMNASERKVVSGDGHGYGSSPPSSAPSPVHLAPPLHARSSSLPRSSPLTPPSPLQSSVPSPAPPPTRPVVLLTPQSSLSPPSPLPRTTPLSTVDERYRQPVAHPQPDLKFHLPKVRSGTALNADYVAVRPEQGQPAPTDQRGSKTGSGVWADDSRNTVTTGLLTPPESRTSVSSEEDLNSRCEGASGEASSVKSVIPSVPPQVELGSLGSGLNLSVRSDEVANRESFDFVKAYMYDPNKMGSQDPSPASSPEVVQGGPAGQVQTSSTERAREEDGREGQGRQRSRSGAAEGRREEGQAGQGQDEARTDKSDHGHSESLAPVQATISSYNQDSKPLKHSFTPQPIPTAIQGSQKPSAHITGVAGAHTVNSSRYEASAPPGRSGMAPSEGMSVNDAQEYANALRRYRGELHSALSSAAGGVSMGQDGSRQSISSIGSESVKSGSIHELSMVDGAGRGGCSMVGIPPVKTESVSVPTTPILEEPLAKERRKSWRWKTKTKEGGVEMPALPMRAESVAPPQIVAAVAPRARHSSLPHSTSGSGRGPIKKYHYSKPLRSPQVRQDQTPIVSSAVQQGSQLAHTQLPAKPVEAVKKKRSTGFRELVGRMFGGGDHHQGGTAGASVS